MKKVIVLAAALLMVVVSANAQKGKWYIGTTNIGAAQTISGNNSDLLFTGLQLHKGDNSNQNIWGIAPEFGYNLCNQWSFGLGLGIASMQGDEMRYGVNPYVRWYALNYGKLSLFLQGDAKYVYTDKPSNGQDKRQFAQLGIIPGLQFDFTRHFSMNAKFGFAGAQKITGVAGAGIIDLSAQTLNFGLVYTF